MALPRLRPLDSFPIQDGDKVYLALRDAEGFTEKLVLLTPLDAVMAARLDGSSTAEFIASEVARQLGVPDFPVGRVRSLVELLEENLMLDSERFRAHREKMVSDFKAAPQRGLYMAGRGYPRDPKALEELFDRYLGEVAAPRSRSRKPLTGLVAPHIDFERGHAGYAHAYRELLASGMADLYVILGVAHATPGTPFVATAKDFETPFGTLKADKELARRLAEDAPYDLMADEFTHRTEHSIEFQSVLLKFSQKRLEADCRILPILASSCDLKDGGVGERAQGVLDRLAGLLEDYKGRVCLLASVDFSHIGPRFGDQGEVTPEFLGWTQKMDRRSLDLLLERDTDGFLDSVLSDGNKRRVCGVAALHAFSYLGRRLHPKAKGRLLHYGHAADPAGGEVTFASLAYR